MYCNQKRNKMSNKETKTIKINITPTWRAVLPSLLAVYRDGTVEGAKIVEGEIKKMANAADEYINLITPMKRSEIKSYLDAQDIVFNEEDSRLNHGLIGNLSKLSYGKGQPLVSIYRQTFYVHNSEFPLNPQNLKLIESIQEQFKEITRDEKGKVITNHFED